MAELKPAPAACCTPEAQADCCEPWEKDGCCAAGRSSCGCGDSRRVPEYAGTVVIRAGKPGAP